MSASEKLKALDGQRRVSGASGLGAAVAETKVLSALPQIVELVEAAERLKVTWAITGSRPDESFPDLFVALAALEEALS